MFLSSFETRIFAFVPSTWCFHDAKHKTQTLRTLFRRSVPDSQRLVVSQTNTRRDTMVILAKVTVGREKIKILERFEREIWEGEGGHSRRTLLAVNANLMRRRFLSPSYLSLPPFSSTTGTSLFYIFSPFAPMQQIARDCRSVLAHHPPKPFRFRSWIRRYRHN